MARPTSSEVPGLPSWASTTTGHPAARVEAVSPPATEKATGKLLAPKTAGPSGMERWRMSGRGKGVRSGSAGSMRAPFQLPSRKTAANRRSWPVLRATSPVMRACGSPVSVTARVMMSPLMASMWSSMVLEELCALLGRRGAIGGESRGGGGARVVDVGGVAVVVGGLKLCAAGGADGVDLLAGSPNGRTGDEHLSRQTGGATNGRRPIDACPSPIIG
jgi:hypothetical protein